MFFCEWNEKKNKTIKKVFLKIIGTYPDDYMLKHESSLPHLQI